MKLINVRAASVLASVLVFSACSSSEPGTPVIDGSSAASAPSEIYTVPPGKRLDVAPFLSSPCELVSEELLVEMGYSASGRPRLPGEDTTADVTGPYCGWSGEDDSRGLTVSIQSGNEQRGTGGLGSLRRAYEDGRFAYWEEVEVGGYPAAYLDLVDRRATGGCGIAVGVAEDMSFSVSVDDYVDQPGEVCTVVTEFAADVIRSLKQVS